MQGYNLKVEPSVINGEIKAPSSKSYAHRILLSAFLSGEEVTVHNLGSSVDVEVTLNAIKTLGASVKINGDTAVVKRGELPKEKVIIDCRESGSSLRFLLPIVCALGVSAEFTGSKRLLERPIKELVDTLNAHGGEIENLTVKGKLNRGVYEVDGGISSQYITGLLLALSHIDGESEIVIKGELVSKPYVDITLSVLSDFGVNFEETEFGYKIKGGYKIKNHEFTVEGDWSGSAFLLSLGAIGGKVTVKGLNVNSCQGDKKIVEILKNFGASVKFSDNQVTVSKKPLTAISVDMQDVPDLVQVVSVVSAYASGVTKIYGVDRLRLKESDRVLAVINSLSKVGIKAEYKDNFIIVNGGKPLGGVVDGGNDHRTVMSAVVMASSSDGESLVLGGQAITKSYPNFVKDFEEMGGKIKCLY